MKRLFGLLLLCAFLACALCGVTTFAAAEENDVTFSFDLRQEKDEIVADVYLTKNDGIVTMTLRVEYDEDALELTDRSFSKSVLAALGPQDNFEEGEYEYPYRVLYSGLSENVTDTGLLLTLRFRVKNGAKNGDYGVQLVVRHVGYYAGSSEIVSNAKYGVAPNDEEVVEGGLPVQEQFVTVSGGEIVAIHGPEGGRNALVIGLVVGGAVIFIAALVVAYLIYRKKGNSTTTGK